MENNFSNSLFFLFINKNSKSEKVKYWSDVLEYRENKVKVIKYIEQEGKEIYVVCTDTNLNEKTINKIIHARWDIENEGFNELKMVGI